MDSRIVIFANGPLRDAEGLRSWLRPSDRIYCADGGTHHALALGLTPQRIVGDLDSLATEIAACLEAAGVSFDRHPADKDQTDLELALTLAVQEQPAEILLVTALGGRLDQTLANIFLLARPDYAGIRLALADGGEWAGLLRAGESLTIQGRVGDTLSLIPLASAVSGVKLAGVKWPLADATLSLGSTLTISNVLTTDTATIQISAGLLLVIHISQGVLSNETNEPN
jgi:thiamine pyrophosphokinase